MLKNILLKSMACSPSVRLCLENYGVKTSSGENFCAGKVRVRQLKPVGTNLVNRVSLSISSWLTFWCMIRYLPLIWLIVRCFWWLAVSTRLEKLRNMGYCFTTFKQPKELHIIEGMKHSPQTDEYRQKVVNKLDDWLKKYSSQKPKRFLSSEFI